MHQNIYCNYRSISKSYHHQVRTQSAISSPQNISSVSSICCFLSGTVLLQFTGSYTPKNLQNGGSAIGWSTSWLWLVFFLCKISCISIEFSMILFYLCCILPQPWPLNGCNFAVIGTSGEKLSTGPPVCIFFITQTATFWIHFLSIQFTQRPLHFYSRLTFPVKSFTILLPQRWRLKGRGVRGLGDQFPPILWWCRWEECCWKCRSIWFFVRKGRWIECLWRWNSSGFRPWLSWLFEAQSPKADSC